MKMYIEDTLNELEGHLDLYVRGERETLDNEQLSSVVLKLFGLINFIYYQPKEYSGFKGTMKRKIDNSISIFDKLLKRAPDKEKREELILGFVKGILADLSWRFDELFKELGDIKQIVNNEKPK